MWHFSLLMWVLYLFSRRLQLKSVSSAPNGIKERGIGVAKSGSSPRRNINKREMRRHLETDRKKCWFLTNRARVSYLCFAHLSSSLFSLIAMPYIGWVWVLWEIINCHKFYICSRHVCSFPNWFCLISCH